MIERKCTKREKKTRRRRRTNVNKKFNQNKKNGSPIVYFIILYDAMTFANIFFTNKTLDHMIFTFAEFYI